MSELDLSVLTSAELKQLYAFFNNPKLRRHYTGLLADIREELKRRGVTPPTN